MTEGIAYNPPLGEGSIAFNTNDYKEENTNILTTTIADERYAKNGEIYNEFTNFEDVEVSIGQDSNETQDPHAIAIGKNSANGLGINSQKENNICIGVNTGLISTSDNAIAIGANCGADQSLSTISLGPNSGAQQQLQSIAIGINSGAIQNSYCQAIGRNAGSNQGLNSISIGNNSTANGPQSTSCIAIGQEASRGGEGPYTISLGNQADYMALYGSTSRDICIGNEAGSQGSSSVNRKIQIGSKVGSVGSLGTDCVAIGQENTLNGSSGSSISVGYRAAGGDPTSTACKSRNISIGSEAESICNNVLDGNNKRNVNIGFKAGKNISKEGCVAIGGNAQENSPDPLSIALGAFSGRDNQGRASCAVGYNSANLNQGSYSNAYGYYAAASNQPNNTFVINNSSSTTFNAGNTDRFYIKNMRSVSSITGLNEVRYNDSTKEVHYDV